MNRVVLDTSAVLAFLFEEEGREKVKDKISDALLSTVNYAEAITKLCEKGIMLHNAKLFIDKMDIEIVDYTAEQALLTGELRNSTRHLGLSLGDRACLALAKLKNLPVLTADSAWAKLDGFDIVLIREPKLS